jgi:hypothetical protein
MLLDGIKLTDTGRVSNVSIESASELPPNDDMNAGQLVYLTAAFNGNPPGLYVTGTDGKWKPTTGVQNIRSNFIGDLTPTVGVSRMYPSTQMRLVNVTAAVGTSPEGSSIKVDIKKNGSSILGGTFLTIAAGDNRSAIVPNSTIVTTDDYLTVDIVGIGSSKAGSDLVVTISYQ